MSRGEHLREYERVRIETEVTMVSEDNFYAGLTDNISEGGLFIATYQSPPIGAKVELVLSLPGQPSYVVQGVVRWIRDYVASSDGVPAGCGIQWLDLPDDALIAIARFVKQRETILHEEAA